ncbi:fibronectin type III domain-containing protein, partial [bacterium]|nr:fibronectin type III domain-containing protein [bacterium]
GFISFTSSGAPYSTSTLPDNLSSGVPDMLAPFWSDLEFNSSPNAYYYNDGSRLIIQFNQVPNLSAGTPNTFEIILYPDGKFVYQYFDMTGDQSSAEVGWQNADGTIGKTVAYGSGFLHNNLAVEVTNPILVTSPRNLTAQTGDGQATLKWSRPFDVSNVLKYYIYQDNSPNPTTLVDSTADADPNDTTKTILSLTNGTFYYFRVTAVDNGHVESNFSNQAASYPTSMPNVITVSNTNDAGAGSLREAISIANANAGRDTILLALAPSSVIYLNSELPAITDDSTMINGDLDYDGTPDISLDGQTIGMNGLVIQSANNVINGLNIGNTLSTNGGAIFIDGVTAHDNTITGNHLIGTAIGLRIDNGAHHNRIGDGTAIGRNVISGNGTGGLLLYNTDHNIILGNYIGTDATGLSNYNNVVGIQMDAANYNVIGDGTPQGANVISGNDFNGIDIRENIGPSEFNAIKGNYIGVAANGVSPISNGSNGIYIFSELGGGGGSIKNDTISANIIAHNGNSGIVMEGADVHNNLIYQNSIYSNGSEGISILNYFGGIYAQENVQPPEITGFLPDSTVTGTAAPGALVQIYADLSGQGKLFLDTTYAQGDRSWSKKVMVPSGNYDLTALQDSNQNTSAFSVPFGLEKDSLLVTTAIDFSTLGSLRFAMNFANSHPGPDSIRFMIPGGSDINISNSLPILTDPGTVINGDLNGDGTPDITLSRGDFNGNGFEIASTASFSKIEGFRIVGFFTAPGAGILVDGANNVIIRHNYIGTANGLSAYQNQYGVRLINGAQFTLIEKNTISGNSNYGIEISDIGTTNNLIVGNYIGTDTGGTAALGNVLEGIHIGNGAKYNRIGDGTTAGRNIISANTEQCVNIVDAGTDSNIVIGNYIGTDTTGVVAIANPQSGVQVGFGAQFNLIGDGTIGGRNIIAGFPYAAIGVNSGDHNIILGNYVGLGADGATAMPNSNGIYITVAKYTKVGNGTVAGRNVVSGNSFDGIVIQQYSDSSEVFGNYVGLDASGTLAVANGGIGVHVRDTTSGVRIGGITAGFGNVISGNGAEGVNLSWSGNFVEGNLIGVDATGLSALPNGQGVLINGSDATNNTIGGSNPNARNTISGNSGEGIHIYQANNNNVLGNYIGTDSTGTAAIANGGPGLNLFQSRGNHIGGNQLGNRNVISGNANFGILFSGSDSNFVFGNYIGTDITGSLDLGNTNFGFLVENSNKNIIGENSTLGRNVISGNDNAGIGLTTNTQYVSSNKNKIVGNYIGTQADGTSPLGNSAVGVYGSNFDPSFSEVQLDTFMFNVIAFNNDDGVQFDGDANLKKNILFGNSIHSNVNSGISYFNGSQEDILAPVITGILSDSTVQGKAAPNALVHIYADSSDEGQVFLDSTIADGLGNWSKKVMLLAGMNLTALQDSAGNTSQFSAPLAAIAPDPLLVTNTNDAGPGSLRDAINYSNAHAGPDTVRFDNTLIGQTINLFSSLVISGDSLIIDGDINADNAPSITIAGDRVMSGIVVAAAYSTIKYMNLQKFNIAILASGVTTHHSRFIGNYIGTNLSGNDTTGTTNNNGIYLQAGAYLNMIGDSLAGA